ncbi:MULTISPECIES: DUF3784 domain-containing protein [Clostridium]|uniref:DUF3784 domain-containing protein n=1 Tax=Clostridium TaxID=1485 RepID=UPI000A04441D
MIKITAPIEIVYILIIVFAVLTIIFLTGKGSSLIKVYSTMEKEEKYMNLRKSANIERMEHFFLCF